MARKEFETVVAQASRESLVRYTNEVSTAVPASTGFEEILIYAGQNQVGKIIEVMVLVPGMAGATGNHEVWMSYNVPNSILHVSTNVDLVMGQSTGATPIQYQFGYWYVANNQQQPPSGNILQGTNIRGAEFDSTVAFRIGYLNYSNIANTNNRKYYVTYTQREVRA
jgi:hypothetical protein